MRRNAKLLFSRTQNRKILTPKEAAYWKNCLLKVCKLGFEHEFNLLEPVGRCTGNSYLCPCNNPKKKTEKCNEKCANSDSCKLSDKYECPGIYCIQFESPCKTCKDFTKNCNDCILYRDPSREPSEVRSSIKQKLAPTNNLAHPGSTGVYEVVDDGSLLGNGGVEISTVGRRIDYNTFFEQAKKIINVCSEKNAYLNERTSVHMHLVAGYFCKYTSVGYSGVFKYHKNTQTKYKDVITEMEKPLPEIVVANFHQLIRRYHNALTWMTSSGVSENNLTRWSKFRIPVIKYSAIKFTSMARLIDAQAQIHGNGKYAFVSYYNCKTDKNSNFSRFHVEARYCDGLLSPAAVASLGVLLHSLLIKAVSLSQYGLMRMGTADYIKDAYTINETLLNNDGPYGGSRLSDTSKFGPYIETVRKEAKELVILLQNELKQHGPAFDILCKLAEYPCSMRLIRGDSWSKIEKDLSSTNSTNKTTQKIKKKILFVIDTLYVDDCINPDEWIATLSEDIKISKNKLKTILDNLVRERSIIWDSVTGSFVRY